MITQDNRKFTIQLYCSRCATRTSTAHYRTGNDRVYCWKCANEGNPVVAVLKIAIVVIGLIGIGLVVARMKGLI